MNKELDKEFRTLVGLGHQFMIQMNRVEKLLGATDTSNHKPLPPVHEGIWEERSTRERYSGLTDGEFGLFPVVEMYNTDPDAFPGLVEHLSSWEQSFLEDWMSPEKKGGYKLTPKQEVVFEKIGTKLSYNIHYAVPKDPPLNTTDNKKESDYANDDIPF